MLDKNNFEAFSDGVARVCEVSGRKIVAEKGSLRFGIRTVGIKRFYEAKIASEKVDRLVSVPYNEKIHRNDILIIGLEQYKIIQIQEKKDSKPPCLYLSLERENILYKKGGQCSGEAGEDR